MIGTKTSRAAPALFAAIALVAIAAASASSAAFAAPPALAGRAGLAVTSKSSAFSGVSQSGADVVISGAQQRRSGAGITGLQMGKVSAVGPFTPAVVALRAVVGEKKFNQIRGKGITLHSQVITEFCVYAGVPRDLRQGLIRLAKGNGNILGFLS